MHLVATAVPSCRFVYLLTYVAASPSHEQIRDWEPTAVELGESGRDPTMSAARALVPFRHAAHGPTPARQLARYRDVDHARLLVRGVHHASPIDQPLHVGVGAASRIGVGQIGLRLPSSESLLLTCSATRPRPAISSNA